MRRLQQNSRRNILNFVLCLSLICAPLFSMRTAYAQAPRLQRQQTHNTTPLQYLAFFKTLLLKLNATLQGGANLDAMRNTEPQAPDPYQPIGTLPPAGYDDPKPTNDAAYDGYLT